MPSARRLRAVVVFSAALIFGLYYFSTTSALWRAPSLHTPPSTKKGPRVHWSKVKERYPATSLIPLPTGTPVSIPKIQAEPKPETEEAKKERLRRKAAVKASFVHSWKGYKQQAWLKDEVVPIAGGYKDTFGGWAATLVDALDTLWIMGMKEEFETAVQAVKGIDFTTTESKEINVFETTIRYMGGFLAAYDISGAEYPVLLAKAVEVGELLMSCFDTPNRMPITRWDWAAYMNNQRQTAPTQMLVSEIGSLSLEFTRLSQLTGDNKYYDAIQRISNALEHSQNSTHLPGMWPIVINAASLSFDTNSDFTLGGMSDSLYEYLPKQYLLLGGLLAQPKHMYESFISVAKKHLFFTPLTPPTSPLLISGDVRVNSDGIPILRPRGQHLGCFTGGMVAIASKIFDRPGDLDVARQLTHGCVWAYDSQPTGIAPEVFWLIPCGDGRVESNCTWTDAKWHQAVGGATYLPDGTDSSETEKIQAVIRRNRLARGFVTIEDRRYILRPEAIESVFILWRVTGDAAYRDVAWRMFEAVERVTKARWGSSAIADVTGDPMEEDQDGGGGEGGKVGTGGGTGVKQMDSMESFWLAETLKYFFLVFEDVGRVSLDEWVLNTEAHPLRRMV